MTFFNQKNSYYNGNPLLVKGNIKRTFSKQEAEEFAKCMDDPVYFCSTYIRIIQVDKGLIPFKMYKYQEKMLNTFHKNRFSICRCPRQSGKTTIVTAYLLWYALFTKDVNVAILANKADTARDILGRLQLAFEHLPAFLKQGIRSWNKGSIEFENGSKIKASATSAASIRGSTYNIIFLDEFAFIPENIADQFFSSTYPTISSGDTTKIIIVSTPNGLNMYYKMWTEATEGRVNHNGDIIKTDYVPVDVHWSEQPGRDEAWKEKTIRNTSEDQFKREFEVEFIGSINTLISPAKLRGMRGKVPIYTEQSNGAISFRVYEQPKREHRYCIVVDPSRGQNLDYSAFSVIDCSAIPYVQVATYRNKNISPILLPTMIFSVAKRYNEAHVLVEINDIGQQVADILHYDLAYDNLIRVETKMKQGQQVSGGYKKKLQMGVKTSVPVKRTGCANLKTLIEGDNLIVNDSDNIIELYGFVSHKESFAAEEGKYDDLTMTLVLFSWLSTQRYFRETIKNDIRQKLQEDELNITDNELLPIPIFDDRFNINTRQGFGGDQWQTVNQDYSYANEVKRRYPFDGEQFPGGPYWDSRL